MPSMSPTVEFLRIVQVALLIVTLVILGVRFRDWWCYRWRCLLPAAGTGAIATLITVGTIDALLHHRPGGVSTFAITLASVALLMQACTVGAGHARFHPPAAPPR